MENLLNKFKTPPNERKVLKLIEAFFLCIQQKDLKSASKFVAVSDEKLIENLKLVCASSTTNTSRWQLIEYDLPNVYYDSSDINFCYNNDNSTIKSIDLGVLYNNAFDGIGAVFNVQNNANRYFLELDCFKIW